MEAKVKAGWWPRWSAGGGRRDQGGARGGAADLQQVVARLPAAQLTDFMKGDAVMIVSTQGATTESATAITMVGGVEPILAAPAGQQYEPCALDARRGRWAEGGGGGQ